MKSTRNLFFQVMFILLYILTVIFAVIFVVMLILKITGHSPTEQTIIFIAIGFIMTLLTIVIGNIISLKGDVGHIKGEVAGITRNLERLMPK